MIPSARHFGACVLLAAAYFVAGKAGLSWAVVHASASAVWPPTGIALAALLLWGRSLWPGIFLGAFLVNVTTAGTIATSLGIAFGNTLEAVAGAWMIERFAEGVRAFDRAEGVIRFGLLGGLVATSLSASIGTATLYGGGIAPRENLGAIWTTWWLGDMAGALVIAPAILLWGSRRVSDRMHAHWAVETSMMALLALLPGLALFGGLTSASRDHLPISFLAFPFVLWSGLRFGPRGAATFTLLLWAVTFVGTMYGFGPFGAAPPNASLVLLQGFLAVCSLTGLSVSAIVERERGARRAAEEAVNNREEFLAIAAHELNTPLAGLRLYAENLLHEVEAGSGDTQTARSLQGVERTTRRLERLIGNMLDFSRIRSGRFELDREETNLVAVAQAAIQDLRAEIERGRAVVSLHSQGSVLGWWDRVRMEQVVSNLIRNAVIYGGGGRIEVGVDLHDGVARIRVHDEGPGISESERKRIFGVFERSFGIDRKGGLGLGLYIVRQIVEAHGGTVRVESAPGHGATFLVEVPCEAARDPAR